MKRVLIGVAGIGLLLFPASVFALRYITGELSGVYSADDYIVTGNIHVLPRTTLRFEPGSTLRFENFTGIVVRGELICKGTILRPITFTSARDVPTSKIMPEAFDWNGIKIMHEASNVCLEHCMIFYSTSGIEIVSNATPVILTEVTFFRNGYASLTRERETITIEDNVPVSYRWPQVTAADTAPSPSNNQPLMQEGPMNVAAPSNTVAPTITPKESSTNPINIRQPFLYTAGSITIASGLLATGAYVLAVHYDRQYDLAQTSTDCALFKKKSDEWLSLSRIATAITGLAAISFSIMFLF